MNTSTGFWDSLSNSGFDFKLFLLVILLSMWLAASLKNISRSSKFMLALFDMLLGLLVGMVLGMAWNANYHAGIFTVAGLTLSVTLVLNAGPGNRLARVLGVLAAFGMALFIYYSHWGGFNFLWETLMEDFYGGS